MTKKINGVSLKKTENYAVFIISELSTELKKIIRERLASVCFGEADASSDCELYCYKNTLKEFLKRYAVKTDAQKKGMIGELLLHVLLSTQLEEYVVNSPFFNLEERSAKKGFDVVLNKKGTTELWLAESKSGEIHTGKTTSQTVVELIGTAQADLDDRLNGDSFSLWLNAINSAKAAISTKRDDREAIISILRSKGVDAINEKITSQDINVILVGTVFHSLEDTLEEEKISEKHTRVKKTNKFHAVYLVAIQKETYTAIYDFLKSESIG